MSRLLNFLEKKNRFNSFSAMPVELNVITGKLFCILLNITVYLQNLCPKLLIMLAINYDVLELTIPRVQLPNILFLLKKHTLTRLNMVIDYTVVDFPGKSLRFEMILLLLSSFYNTRIKIRFFTNEVAAIYTITCLYQIGFWLEREIWDMFGVVSRNHADLRRILTDYGFIGHPLRKDFPVTGYFEYFFDDFIRNLLNIKVSLAQELRYFFFLQSWSVIN